ncbi:MAG: NAD-dependent epimerase/dehydratase family protein, partial [Pseudomonadota bacterium]
MAEATERRVLVLGGNGFVGSHAVTALSKRDSVRLSIGTRKPLPRQDGHKETAVEMHRRTDVQDWTPLVANYDVVLNCVGILRPVGRATYDRVHHLA